MTLDLTTIFLVILAGITSVASPCVLPVLPVVMTGTSEDHRFRPLLIVAGLSITFILMGIVSTLFGSLISERIFYIEKIVGVIIIAFGVLMILNRNPFNYLTFLQSIQVNSRGVFSGLILGLSLGIIWIPCIGPILSGVLAMVAVQNQIVSGVVLLLFYALGFSIPMLIAGYGSQFFRQKISFIQKHPIWIRFLSGGILVVFGFYIVNWGLLGFGF